MQEKKLKIWGVGYLLVTHLIYNIVSNLFASILWIDTLNLKVNISYQTPKYI